MRGNSGAHVCRVKVAVVRLSVIVIGAVGEPKRLLSPPVLNLSYR